MSLLTDPFLQTRLIDVEGDGGDEFIVSHLGESGLGAAFENVVGEVGFVIE